MYALYLLKKSDRNQVDKMLADDMIGRQAITQKDASQFGLSGDMLVLLYEGSEEANQKLNKDFSTFLKPMEKEKASEVYKSIKDEESQAEGGMGFLFG